MSKQYKYSESMTLYLKMMHFFTFWFDCSCFEVMHMWKYTDLVQNYQCNCKSVCCLDTACVSQRIDLQITKWNVIFTAPGKEDMIFIFRHLKGLKTGDGESQKARVSRLSRKLWYHMSEFAEIGRNLLRMCFWHFLGFFFAACLEASVLRSWHWSNNKNAPR